MTTECSSSSSSHTKQVVGWIVLSSCAALALHYFRPKDRKEKDRDLLKYFSESALSSTKYCSIDRSTAIMSGMKRIRELDESDCARMHDEGNVYEHQVAGHTEEIILSYKDMILKPMIKERNFLKEVQFYEYVISLGAHSSQSPASFLPKYHGVLHVHDTCKINDLCGADGERSSGEKKIESTGETTRDIEAKSPSFYLVLENVTKKFRKPCVLDLKIGRQTFEPTASEEKKKRNVNKFLYQDKLGFRISGFKSYNVLTGEYSIEGKEFGRSLKPEEVVNGLEKFFYNGRSVRREVINIVLQKLERLRRWMSKQNTFHFYCSSILVAYDGLKLQDDFHGCPESAVDVRIIDFAHTMCDENGTNDEGYVYGLRSLIKYLQEVLSK